VLNLIVPLAGFPTFKAERKMRFHAPGVCNYGWDN